MALSKQRNGTVGIFHMMLKVVPQRCLKVPPGWFQRSTNLTISSMAKFVQIINCTCTVFIDNYTEIFQLTHPYRYQFVGEVMTHM